MRVEGSSRCLRSLKPLRLGSIALCVATPAAMTLLLLFLAGRSILDFVPPASTNDETFYWHAIYTFSEVGFDGGFYTNGEHPAEAGFSRLGVYGPFFPALYGSLGRVLGWHLYSAPIFHLLFITAGLCLFVRLTGLESRSLIVATALLATFWPMLLYIATNMQEGLHYAIAIALAAVFYRLVAEPHKATPTFMALSLALILFAALLRITWSVLLVPFALLGLRSRSTRGLILALAGALAGMIFAWLLMSYLASDAEGILQLPDLRSGGIGTVLDFVGSHAGGNLRALFGFEGLPQEVFLRCQLLLLAIGLGIYWALRPTRSLAPHVLFHFFNLVVILILTILFYLVGNLGDYRLLSIHLLASLLFAVGFKGHGYRVAVWLLILSNALFSSRALVAYENHARAFSQQRAEKIAVARKQVEGVVVYDPDADPWCNSLAFWFERPYWYPPELAALPAGIGINLMRYGESPRKSRYLLMNQRRHRQMQGRLPMKFLKSTSMGELYLNLQSPCEP